MWCQNISVTLDLRIGTTHGPVTPVLARAAGLYPALTGSIPVTGSRKSMRHKSAGANPAAPADWDGSGIFENARAQFRSDPSRL